MYGNNPVRKQHLNEEGNLWVQEIFATLQGEGTHAGTPSIFVRLAGCNLRCTFCDTQFETAFAEEENFRSVENVCKEINALNVESPGCTNIVVTGGEPFRQNFVPLASRLLELGFTIEIETAGTLWIEEFCHIANNCHVTVSPKTPKINPYIERAANAYKFVVSVENCPSGECLAPLSAVGKPLPMPKFSQQVFIQPMDVDDPIIRGRNIDTAVRLVKQTGWRLSVQIHKMIGVE